MSAVRSRGRARWWRAACALGCALALAGCAAVNGSGPLSDIGQPIMIVIARQPVYVQSTCSGQTIDMLPAGGNVVDLGTMGTNCEQVVFRRDGSYSAIGYLPVYGMRRAAGGVRCRATVDCHLRAGPGTNFALMGAVAPGGSARGYGTARTQAIITDGDNYDWWEVVDPETGRRADIFAPNCQAF
ncbi:MAG: hypothetical protein PVSMB4_05280 [Ktedonobacterales bacterium]